MDKVIKEMLKQGGTAINGMAHGKPAISFCFETQEQQREFWRVVSEERKKALETVDEWMKANAS